MHYWNQHLLTAWSKISLENLTGSNLVNKNSPHFMEPDGSLSYSQEPASCPYPVWTFRNEICFYAEELSAPAQLEEHPLSAVRDCLTLILLTWKIWWDSNNASRWQMGFNSAFKGLINIFTAILHPGGRSSIHKLRTRHALVTGPTYHGLHPILRQNIPLPTYTNHTSDFRAVIIILYP